MPILSNIKTLFLRYIKFSLKNNIQLFIQKFVLNPNYCPLLQTKHYLFDSNINKRLY